MGGSSGDEHPLRDKGDFLEISLMHVQLLCVRMAQYHFRS